MAFCMKCGNQLEDNEQFCSKCGEKVDSTGKDYNISVKKTQLYKIKMKMMISVIVLGIALLALGFVFHKVSESKKGTNVSFGYFSNGKLVKTGEGGVVGADKEAMENFYILSICCYILGFSMIIAGVLGSLKAKSIEKHPIIRQYGKVIEKPNSHILVVEFEDGSRKRLVAEPSILLRQDESGIIGYKDNSIVEFTSR